ncbi:hypothetical protein EMB92_10465 [Bifidobacterium callitrichos]|uniref:Uncharacterized protein n=1 Tax=Bifidobacterium callitrichos TaxID=762209 RepID=A0A5M9ZAP2_9BIFI|nr:hypothetical protein [Bifidobacterium callitrichos]KAA8815572.1 hypothetical protein EMB92_10465 [Bifidobacterium callitrichos]
MMQVTTDHDHDDNDQLVYDREYYEQLGEELDKEMMDSDYPEPIDLADDPNPAARLKRLVYQRQVFERENKRRTVEIVEELRRRGNSWSAIGKLMNISGEAVRKQYSR